MPANSKDQDIIKMVQKTEDTFEIRMVTHHASVKGYAAALTEALYRDSIGSPSAVKELISNYYRIYDDNTEHFIAITTNSSYKPINIFPISTGSIQQTAVDMPKLIRGLLLSGAKYFFVCHNHPSGNPNMSTQDQSIIDRIGLAATIYDIKLVSTFIYTQKDIYEFEPSMNYTNVLTKLMTP